ncbi:MAG: HD-GYP domain-containing protein [Pseudomonadota bacterium]
MLKKIHVRDIRLGMYVQELCGNWMDHPFWKSSFKLSEPRDLTNLRECGIQEVWIDIDKGLDVKPVAPVATEGVAKVEAVVPPPASEKKRSRPVALHEEIQRAEKLYARAQKTVASIFNESRLGNALATGETVALVDEITLSVTRNSSALLSLTRFKDRDNLSYQHSLAVSILMIALGRQMGLQENVLRSLGVAGLLHDVGKMMIPAEIQNKPGKLNDHERRIMQTHPVRGRELLKQHPDADEIVLDVCLHHHERMDGAGYPEKLAGANISQYARMAAICDAYDDLTSVSSYKKSLEPAVAIRKMSDTQSGHLDPAIFHAFVKAVGIYPAGTLVKLKSGRLAVVTDQSAKSLLAPVVKVFFSTRVNEPIIPELVDLSKVPDEIANVEDPVNWKFDIRVMAGI